MPNLEIFNDYQKQIIELGEKAGIDTSFYTKTYKYSSLTSPIYNGSMHDGALNEHERPVFSYQEMEQIYLGLIEGLDVTHYNITKYESIYRTHESVVPVFNAKQMEQIRLGLKANVDVSLYTRKACIDGEYKPVYDDKQMEQIRLGLIDNLLVFLYADPRNDSDRMNILRQMLMYRNNFALIRQYCEFVDVENGSVPLYDNQQLLQILLGMAAHFDFIYDSISFDAQQMEQIRLGIMENLDTSQYAKPNISAEDMRIKRQSLKETIKR